MLIDDKTERKQMAKRGEDLREEILKELRSALNIAVEKRRKYQKSPHRNLKAERRWARVVDMLSSQINSILEGDERARQRVNRAKG